MLALMPQAVASRLYRYKYFIYRIYYKTGQRSVYGLDIRLLIP